MEPPSDPPSPEDANVSAARRPLRILHLEDNSHDRELIRQVLRQADLPCEVLYAANGAEFRDALVRGNIDLILSDFTMPGYDGSAALALARELRAETPYLFVSGTIGEERAVESLRNGAVDYVLKSNLTRLPAAIRAAIREVHERRRRHQAEQALRESEERFREMAGSIRDVFWSAAPDCRRPVYVSPGYEAVWGRPVSELRERPGLWLESILPADRPRVLAAFDTLPQGRDVQVEYRILRPDGAVRWIENRVSPALDAEGRVAHAVGVAADITRRKQLQEQLQQAQKMEALGQLAGGIAHDFNNLLTVINGYASLTLGRTDVPDDILRPLQQIYSAGERAANLTRQLLVFSRKEEMRLAPVDVNEALGATTTMLGRLIGEHIRLDLALAPGIPRVEADAHMLEQAVMNLAVNARDAMPSGGRLGVATEVVKFDEAAARALPHRRAGTFVRLSVSDTGMGIAPDLLPRIFEPFFTTKKSGEGTGLGLAMVFGIMENHQGWVEVESQLGSGTTFHLFLPAVPAIASNAPDTSAAPAESPAQAPILDGDETILLVEDEAPVREFTRAVLQHHGYRVLQASSGKDALETWRWHSARIRLLLTDMVLPDQLDGLALAQRFLAEKPSLRVLCISGYTREMLDQHARSSRGVRFLQKPFQPALLVRTVRECLDGAAPASASAPPPASPR